MFSMVKENNDNNHPPIERRILLYKKDEVKDITNATLGISKLETGMSLKPFHEHNVIPLRPWYVL